ncbi:hypothetical protein Metev_0154 [Methanohalobium evestigatum Z-7303]|uniref:Uncharacterized protein n=1 Tax=Methanohalobium evestigatum (strain ATCC BAA-1072 / DSM 3721 / NBRC 107634 / OCM 161 / Z-7303) TaxID=644295 RepID=D7E663_METEZ|nr:hypothetical protein [Methanohalobium evestigatum]ADI73085.1 hypothetical protein Metev_0154 [Methanohalobium evestigatum Z-7303]
MHNDYRLTAKELQVLKHFVLNESNNIDDVHFEYRSFYSYPGRIENDINSWSNIKVSRVHAKEICEKFIVMNLLAFEDVSESKRYYFLKPGIETLRNVIHLFYRNLDDKEYFTLFRQSYIQSKINDKLVIYELNKRGITFRKKLDIIDWPEDEAKELLQKNPELSSISFEKYMQKKLGAKDKFGKQLKGPHDIKFDIKFPVLDISNKNMIHNINDIEHFNKDLFSIYPDLKQYPSAIYNHYQAKQENYLILPILLFIKVSHNALKYFLCDEWPSDKTEFFWYADDSLDHKFLFFMNDLMVLSFKDMAFNKGSAGMLLINNACFNGILTLINGEEENKLCFFELHNDFRKYYFDSILYQPGGLRPMDIGITINNKLYIYKINSIIDNFKLKSSNVSHAKDELSDMILNYLKNDNNPIIKTIKSYLPNQLNNAINYCDTSNISRTAKTMIKRAIENELRWVLIKEDWNHLSYNDLSETSIKKLSDYRSVLEANKEHMDSGIDTVPYKLDAGGSIFHDVFGEDHPFFEN